MLFAAAATFSGRRRLSVGNGLFTTAWREPRNHAAFLFSNQQELESEGLWSVLKCCRESGRAATTERYSISIASSVSACLCAFLARGGRKAGRLSPWDPTRDWGNQAGQGRRGGGRGGSLRLSERILQWVRTSILQLVRTSILQSVRTSIPRLVPFLRYRTGRDTSSPEEALSTSTYSRPSRSHRTATGRRFCPCTALSIPSRRKTPNPHGFLSEKRKSKRSGSPIDIGSFICFKFFFPE